MIGYRLPDEFQNLFNRKAPFLDSLAITDLLSQLVSSTSNPAHKYFLQAMLVWFSMGGFKLIEIHDQILIIRSLLYSAMNEDPSLEIAHKLSGLFFVEF